MDWLWINESHNSWDGIYVQASDQVFPMIKMEETNYRIQNRIQGELHFLDGQTLCATLALNKHVWKT
jgi:thermospermine synthase